MEQVTVKPIFTVYLVIEPPHHYGHPGQSQIIPLILSPVYSGYFVPVPRVTIIVRFHFIYQLCKC